MFSSISRSKSFFQNRATWGKEALPVIGHDAPVLSSEEKKGLFFHFIFLQRLPISFRAILGDSLSTVSTVTCEPW
jgi:hypothetical protein